MVKKILSVTFALLLFLGITFVLADDVISEIEVPEIATEEDFVVAGMTPDNFLYGIEVIIERFTEIFSEDAKIAHMEERVSEAKVMLYENKINYSLVAILRFNKTYNRLKNKTRLQEHGNFMNNLGRQISIIAKEGNMTDSDRASIKQLIQTHKEVIRSEKISIISDNKDMTQIQAGMVFDNMQQQLRDRVTGKIKTRIQNFNNTHGNKN